VDERYQELSPPVPKVTISLPGRRTSPEGCDITKDVDKNLQEVKRKILSIKDGMSPVEEEEKRFRTDSVSQESRDGVKMSTGSVGSRMAVPSPDYTLVQVECTL